jgi:hypothetical protein
MNHEHVVGPAQTKRSKKALIVVTVVAIAVLAASLVIWKVISNNMLIKSSQYQAVFLANGQTYFGKLSNVNDQYVRLTDIYYLQVQQSVQPAQSDAQNQPKVSLVKLGSELHGPEDEMLINRDQVYFWENLKDDSKVVSAIKENQK